jgi:5-methylcytosine-specific restriction endonuclease McrA
MWNMTSPSKCPNNLSDRDLLTELERAARSEQRATAHLIALLMEVDSRKLYAGQGCSSLFIYCVRVLHLSEHAAYLRIEGARAARRFSGIPARLADGSLHLTAVSLLAPHLTDTNHVELLDAARHKSKREIEQLIARLRPQPDVPSVVRKLPEPARPRVPGSGLPVPSCEVPVLPGSASTPEEDEPNSALPAPLAEACPTPRRPEIKPLAPERYKVQCTVSRETYDKLRRVQDLLRHTIPAGDLSAIFDRALTALLNDLSKTKFAASDRPQRGRVAHARSRHIPAGIKRDVWTRDGGRCAFQGEQGRCAETGFLEFHHVVPFADGGEASVSNVELRCRSHNQYEAERWFSATLPCVAREMRAVFGT